MKSHTPLKAIRAYCHDCAGGSFKDVILCSVLDCPLKPLRFGVAQGSRVYKAKIERALRTWPQEAKDAGLQ